MGRTTPLGSTTTVVPDPAGPLLIGYLRGRLWQKRLLPGLIRLPCSPDWRT